MSDFYEDRTILSEYMLFHYGTPEQVMPWGFGPVDNVNFPKHIAHLFKDHYPISGEDNSRALDIGCAVGRSSFELTRWFDEVVGVDFSHAFIEKASQLAKRGSLEYEYRIQGDQFQKTTCTIPDGSLPERVHFLQGDAMKLSELNLGTFDLILASNLICRLPNPAKFLSHLSDHLNRGGVFILSTPYSYTENFTEKNHWLGGQTGGQLAHEAVQSVLTASLVKIAETNIPMLIREHQRKFQWTVCHVTAWKK